MRRGTRPTIGGVLLGAWMAVGLGGCAAKGDLTEVERTLVAEIRTLEARQDTLAREIRELRGTLLDSLRSRERASRVDRTEMQRRFDDLEQRIGQLSALVGESHRMLTELRSRVSGLARGSGSGGAEGGGAAGDTAAAGDAEAAPPGETAQPESTRPSGLYEAALQQFRRGSYETARGALEEFLRRYPEHELAPDAQYYVAETYAETGELSTALDEYARVLQLFPNSRRAPASLYKSGRIELERGNVEDARNFFTRIVRGYPDSDEADLARDQLDRLGG